MNETKELLLNAAKAAGIEPATFNGMDVGWYVPGSQAAGSWDPLDNDGDAFRLAVTLRLKVRYHGALGQALVDKNLGDAPIVVNIEDCGRNEFAAVRLAIVKVASEIGKSMP